MIYNIQYRPTTQQIDIYGNPINLLNLTSMLHEPIYEPVDAKYETKYNLKEKFSDNPAENNKTTVNKSPNKAFTNKSTNPNPKKVVATNKDAWDLAWSEYGSKFGLSDKEYLYLLAQIEYESNNFKNFEESDSGEKYEMVETLGNTNEGDGIKFKGRGAIQVTGRYNYETIYKDFFVPNGLGEYNIVEYPELAKDPYIGSLISIGWLSATNNGKKAISAIKKNNVEEITKAINGGTNGLQERKNITLRLLKQYKYL